VIVKPFNKPESQFTQLHNSIFDVIMRLCTNSEWKILSAVLRKTRGWDKPGDDISYSQIKELTGIASSSTIATALKGLIHKDMVIASKHDGATTFYQLNQNYTIELTSPKIGQVEASEANQSKNRTGTCPKIGHPTCPKIGHTKDSLNLLNKKIIINQAASDFHQKLIQNFGLGWYLQKHTTIQKAVKNLKCSQPGTDGEGTFYLQTADWNVFEYLNDRLRPLLNHAIAGIKHDEFKFIEIVYLDSVTAE